MFDNLSDKLQRVFKNLRGEGSLTAENMEVALREIRVALLEADVNFKVVKQLIESMKSQALWARKSSSPSPRTSKSSSIVSEELIKILGSHESKLRFANDPPSVFLIVGLQGSGKTTSTGKLARWLSKNGHRPDVGLGRRLPSRRPPAAGDPRARKQASRSTQAKTVKTPRSISPVPRAATAVNAGRDVLLVDTAGRLHIDDELMDELQQLKELLNPVEILFVADAMTGQDAVKSADEFHKRLGITGVILTKMDGDARGGAALSIRHVTGQPLKFVGIGEKSDALEAVPSRPRGLAHPGHGRHPLSFIEKAEEAIDKKQAGRDAAQADRKRVHARGFSRSAQAVCASSVPSNPSSE